MALLGLFYGQETFSKVNQLRIRPKLYAFVAAGLMGHCPLVMYVHSCFILLQLPRESLIIFEN